MKAKVNQRFEYQVSLHPHIEVQHLTENRFRLRKNEEVFEIELLEYHLRNKTFVIAMKGFVLEVCLEDGLDEIIQRIGHQIDSSVSDRVIKAPIPGLIKALFKENGDPVNQGDSVLILEAMKMENAIQAPFDSKGIEHHVSLGEHVVKGQNLFTLL